MSIIDYIISIKNEAERICISLKTSEASIEIMKQYCQKLEAIEIDDEKILTISTPTIYLSIPEKEIDADVTFTMNKHNLFYQDEDYKKQDNLRNNPEEEISEY